MAGYVAHLGENTTTRFDLELLGGVMILEHPGSIKRMADDPGLYYPASEPVPAQEVPTTLKLIPFYAWANRGPAAMQVWIPYQQV